MEIRLLLATFDMQVITLIRLCYIIPLGLLIIVIVIYAVSFVCRIYTNNELCYNDFQEAAEAEFQLFQL